MNNKKWKKKKEIYTQKPGRSLINRKNAEDLKSILAVIFCELN